MSKGPESAATRRGFLKLVGGGVVLLPLVGVGGCSRENGTPPATTTGGGPAAAKPPASGQPRLAEDDPTAMALGYRHDATQVDTSRYPQRAGAEGANQFCHNCALFQAAAEQEWGPCTIFPGRAVNAAGWCTAWAPKA